jgi:hypothetical protein
MVKGYKGHKGRITGNRLSIFLRLKTLKYHQVSLLSWKSSKKETRQLVSFKKEENPRGPKAHKRTDVGNSIKAMFEDQSLKTVETV